MSSELILRSEAENEIKDAFDWHEIRNPGLGFDFLLCVDAAFNSIARTPNRFPLVYCTVRRLLVR